MSLAVRELDVLNRLIRDLSANPEPSVLFATTLARLTEVMEDLQFASIHLMDHQENSLSLVESLRLSGPGVRALSLLQASDLAGPEGHNQSLPFEADPVRLGLAREGAERLVAAPIRSASLLIGYLLVQTPHRIGPETETFLATLGHILGLVIEQAGLISQMSSDLERIKAFRAELEKNNLELERQVVRVEEANRHKSQFLANVSHEIRTPMNGILGMTELALSTRLDARQRRYLEVVQSSAEALLVLINDLLDLSRIDAGRMELEEIPFDLRALVEKVVEGLSLKAEDKGLSLACRLKTGTPTWLKGDPGRLRQILINLLDNAIKFTDRGEVSLSVSIQEKNRTRVRLRFAVQDSGVGISRADQEKIFQPFVQVDGSTTRIHGGTGLGLSIVRQLVEMMGGRIKLESKPGQGSRFSFALDFTLHDGGREERKAETVVMDGTLVLVVDDNPTNRLVLAEMLGTWGAEVVQSGSGEEVLEELARFMARGRTPGLILLDGQLPDQDGFEVVEGIRERKLAAGAPILMLTSVGRPGDARRCRELGIRGYLTKPAKMDDIKRAVNQALSQPAGAGEGLITRHSLAESRPGIRLLVAEDNPVNRMVIEEVLSPLGFEVVGVDNGRAVLAELDSSPFDLVLMDLQMPVMDGFSTARKIRRNPHFKDLPIIALTAHAMVGDREACLEAGMNDYLAKPVKSGELIKTIERHLALGREDLLPHPGAGSLDRPDRPDQAGQESAPDLEGAPPLDLAEARLLVDGDEGLLKRMIKAFLNDTLGQIETLKEALASGDGQEAAQAAHRIKGAAAQLAAREARILASRIEDLADRGRAEAARSLVEDLETCLAKVEKYLGGLVRDGE